MLQGAPKTRRGELYDVCSRSFLIFMVDVNFWNRTWHNPSVVGARVCWGFSGGETFDLQPWRRWDYSRVYLCPEYSPLKSTIRDVHMCWVEKWTPLSFLSWVVIICLHKEIADTTMTYFNIFHGYIPCHTCMIYIYIDIFSLRVVA